MTKLNNLHIFLLILLAFIFLFSYSHKAYTKSFTIKEVIIKNNFSISKKEILEYLNIKENSEIEISTLLKLKDSLLNWGYFQNVRIDFQKNNSKITIIIYVKENPILKDIEVFVNNKKSLYYNKYIKLSIKKAINFKLFEKYINNLYKFPEIEQISYKFKEIKNKDNKPDSIKIIVYITKQNVTSCYIGIYNYFNLSAGIEKINFLFPVDIYIGLIYGNQNIANLENNFLYTNLYSTLNFSENFYLFTVFSYNFLPYTQISYKNLNFITGLFFNINSESIYNFIYNLDKKTNSKNSNFKLSRYNINLSLFYNKQKNTITFFNTDFLAYKNIYFFIKNNIHFNPYENQIIITNSTIGLNEFYATNSISNHFIVNSFVEPFSSLRGFSALFNISDYLNISDKYIYNLNSDLIFKIFYINLLKIGIILSDDLILLSKDSQSKILNTLGVGLYFEISLGTLFKIPIIFQIYTNTDNFSKYSFHFELFPYKLK